MIDAMQETSQKLKRFNNYVIILSLVNTFISLNLWITFSFLISGYLSFGARGNYRLGATLETIAAVASLSSFILTIQIFQLQRSNRKLKTKESIQSEQNILEKVQTELNNTDNKTTIEKNNVLRNLQQNNLQLIQQSIKKNKKDLDRIQDEEKNPYKKYLRKSTYYLDIIGATILTTMQVTISIDLLSGAAQINKLHKSLGLAFNMQTIIDTLGLSIIFLSLSIKMFHKVKEKHETSVKDKIMYIIPTVILPTSGLFFILLGKIFLGFESNNTVKFPINNGKGYFPLALTLRMVGACITIISLISFDLLHGLNKTSLEDTSIAITEGMATSAAN
ncbi:MAG: hypothetical protein HRK26_03795 [Rickettsiaceae bacterium H1]|nr:hypothetical protein [Rickettsiaceae bacterium H1]